MNAWSFTSCPAHPFTSYSSCCSNIATSVTTANHTTFTNFPDAIYNTDDTNCLIVVSKNTLQFLKPNFPLVNIIFCMLDDVIPSVSFALHLLLVRPECLVFSFHCVRPQYIHHCIVTITVTLEVE
jgi:hypothetical protein